MNQMSRLLLVATSSCAIMMAASDASGQTCSAPIPWQSDPSGQPPATADVCAASDEVALFCDFLDSANKPEVIWSVVFADGYTSSEMVVNGAAAGFNPVLYLYSGPCSSGSGCIRTADQGSPMNLAGIPSGTYFLAATAAASDAPGACGAVVIDTNGWLPVALQSFSIE
jgi:hypothetical protein